MNIYPIRNEADYQSSLSEIQNLFDSQANTLMQMFMQKHRVSAVCRHECELLLR